MKFEDILAIVLGILLGWILGFTKFDLPLPVRIHKVNVIDPMNATEIIEKHLWNCNEYDWLANDINKRWKQRSDCIGKPHYILCVVSFIEEKCYLEFDKRDIDFLILYFKFSCLHVCKNNLYFLRHHWLSVVSIRVHFSNKNKL